MKLWTGQTFPIVLLAFLAGLSFWLEHAVDLPETRRDGKQRHDPDTFVENFSVRRLDVNGTLRYRLTSPYMEHYPDDDSALLRDPKLVHYRPGAPDTTLSGKHAYVIAKGETVFFWGDVVARRAATPRQTETIARMPDLTVQPDEGIAFTGSPVEIARGPSWVKGVGMHLDNNTSVLVLQSRVTGLLYRSKASK